MTHFHFRHLLCLLLTGTGISSLYAQTSKPFTPGSRIKVEQCQRVEMQATRTGSLNIVATPANKAHTMGYTDHAIPSDVAIPDNMKDWLECVEQGAAYVEAHPEIQLGTTAAMRDDSKVVEPLLGDIEWDQGDPFNRLCPSGTPVGCVATAMAQVMLYYRYPDHGYGSHTWRWNGITHSVDFGATTYNWDLMLPRYDYTATPEQQNEAAKLSYHCGVSINMSYQTDGSGALCEHIPYSLKTYFGYNDRVGVIFRESYSYEGWNEVVTNELLAGRPVIFSAFNTEAGHAFVIDGRDANGLFHVNWGWNGYYNGYFDICILNPYGAGIGAVEDEVGFCMGQNAIVQICPEKGVGEKLSPVKSSGAYSNSNEYYLVLGTYIENVTYDTLQGVSAIEVLDAMGQHVCYEMGDTITLYPYGTWDGRNNRFYFAWTNTYAASGELADGDYTAVLAFQCFDTDTVTYQVPTHYYQTPRFDFSVKDGLITSTDNNAGKGNIIEGHNFSLQGQELATGKEYIATIDIENHGNDAFSGAIMLDIYYPDGTASTLPSLECSDHNVFIPAGGTYQAQIPVVIKESGDWQAKLIAYNYLMDYFMNDCPMDNTISFSSRFTEESPASLQLIEAVELLTERCEVDGEIAFQMILRNEGGKFCDRLGMQFYAGKNTSGNPAFSIDEEVEVAMGTEADTIVVKGLLTEAKGMKKYYAMPFYRDNYGQNQRLKLVGNDGNTTTPEPIEVRVYNASGIETITTDPNDLKTTQPCYDLYGRPVKEGFTGRLIIGKDRKALILP